MDNNTSKGIFLKKTRESKGISLEVVHETTKIPLDVLKAIEEGYTIRTLTPFYHRGFLKIYARYLGVNIAEVVDDYQPEKLPEHVKDKVEDLLPRSNTIVITPQIKNLIIKILIGLVAFFVVIKLGSFIIHKWPHKGEKVTAARNLRNSEKKKTVKTAPVTIPVEKKKPIVEKSIAPESVPSPVPAMTYTSKASSAEKERHRTIDVTVRAKKDSWLQVKVDGEAVFRSTLKRGVTESWQAKDNMEISGKDISDLELELNGKILGPLSKENRRAKRVVIDHNGFSVKQ